MQDLNERLDAALATVAACTEAYGAAALAVEEGQAGAAQLTDTAAINLEASERRVTDLRAAIVAAESREIARQNEAAATADAEHRAALNSVLDELNRAAIVWDAALDALAGATDGMADAADRLRGLHASPEVYKKLEHAYTLGGMVVAFRIRRWTGNTTGPFFKDERLAPHLPAAVLARQGTQ